MDRRTFIETIASIGLYPIGARAFGTRTPKAQKPAESGAIAVSSVSRHGMIYECIVGDMQTNANGHCKTKQVWESMFEHIGKRGPFVVLTGDDRIGLFLQDVAGIITDYRITDKVWVKMKVTSTPKGDMFLTMPVPFFLTADGKGNLDTDGCIVNYQFTQFRLSNNSAFDCATPLVPYADNENGTTSIRV